MKNVNKKLMAIIIVIGVVLLGFGIYNLLSPGGEEGSKEVTIKIMVESENIDFSETYKTDEEFLEGLIEAKKEDLNAVTKDSEYGPMVLGLKGYEVDETKEYFHIQVDSIDAITGIKEIPLMDGSVYFFEVKGF